MKNTFYLIFAFFNFIACYGQGGMITIEGQILGYTGNKSIGYTLNDYYRLDDFTRIKPDSLGRFVISREIKGTTFFSLIYIQDSTYHSCKLIVEPGNKYSFMSKGRYVNDMKHYSPDIYTLYYKKENDLYYKRDFGQMCYNMIDNNTRGAIYRDDWDMMSPDSLLPTLKRKINNQVSVFENLLDAGEINSKFYEVAKLSVEYTQAYRLATTIVSTGMNRFKINDTTVNRKLLEIYPKIYDQYPVNKSVNIQYYYEFDKYVDLYLEYLSESKSGKFMQYQKMNLTENLALSSEEYLNPQAYSTYSFIHAINNMASLGMNAGDYGREVLKKHPDINKEIRVFYDKLLEKVDEFDKLEQVDFPKNIIILDDIKPINSFSELQNILGNHPALIDIWGTWCLPCRGQFQYQETIKPFLKRNGIKMVYIAFEYGDTRKKWENLIKAYKLEGSHFVTNDNFTSDLEKYAGKISKFPTFLIIDCSGNIVEDDAYFPSDSEMLINQLKQKLNLY